MSADEYGFMLYYIKMILACDRLRYDYSSHGLNKNPDFRGQQHRLSTGSVSLNTGIFGDSLIK